MGTERRVPQRTVENLDEYICKFILGRLAGFEKDFRICMKPIKAKHRSGVTHAYFPALAACCGTLEYMTALHAGKTKSMGSQQISDWANRYLPQPDYNRDTIRILFEAFRNPVAHKSVAGGVWVDKVKGEGHGRRIVWKVLASGGRPPIQVVEEKGQLLNDPPWPCPYTHRAYIYLRSLKPDVVNGAMRYLKALLASDDLQDKFVTCVNALYPP